MQAELPRPVRLRGAHVHLEPLSVDHLPELFAASGGDDQVWQWLPVDTPRTEQDLADIAAPIIAEQEAGQGVAFTVLPRSTGRPSGWTTMHDAIVGTAFLHVNERPTTATLGADDNVLGSSSGSVPTAPEAASGDPSHDDHEGSS